jgi:hypothetical protein
MTTELERVRAMLGVCQANLRYAREMGCDYFDMPFHEERVLAALSWVWDAQERAGANHSLFEHGAIITLASGETYRVLDTARGV